MLPALRLAAVMVLAQAGAAALQARETAYARLPLADRIGNDPELVKAIVAKNQVVESPGEIRRIDEEWIRNRRYPLRKALTSGPCADRLRRLVRDDKLVVEAFLMDDRGGLVCATVETSDYWQGDEAKWQKTYRDGAAVFVDEPALDASTGTFAVQLSRLVSDAHGKVGALTLTLKVPRSRTRR
ncbi:MAG: hypothetical protein DMF80_20685 [Acidobacteria bacterium]|nr:MAG: hypothetical protein DMF80_20685 [Acidobacteriota bacterium]PYQ21057.1 MAG: hypothetical protein DMF81_16675 [Acidobacteriota bacterium]